MNDILLQQSTNYNRIAQSIEYVSSHLQDQPSLEEMAAHVHLSKYHFQRLFKRWAGVTPTQFLHFLTVEYAKERLTQAESVFNASLDAGLSGSGRLHDLFVSIEAMTPGEYKGQGDGLRIRFGIHNTPFGCCLIATTSRGICALRFIEDEEEAVAQLMNEWSRASFVHDQVATQPLVDRLFSSKGTGQQPFHLHLRGTNFQLSVWKALLTIPAGALVTYQDVANSVGKPKAVRAVANAIAHNPIGYLIPCHRVINQAGEIHRYRWGATRKKAMVGWEAGQQQTAMLA